MKITFGMMVSYVLVPIVPSVGAALTSMALTRPRVGLFTTDEVVASRFWYDRYQFKSANHRRALQFVLLVEFFILFFLTPFLCDTFLVNP